MEQLPVHVASFAGPLEAHILKTRLEHEGITCLLMDEHVNRVYGQVISVRLFVAPEDVQRAQRMVARYRNFHVVEEDETA